MCARAHTYTYSSWILNSSTVKVMFCSLVFVTSVDARLAPWAGVVWAQCQHHRGTCFKIYLGHAQISSFSSIKWLVLKGFILTRKHSSKTTVRYKTHRSVCSSVHLQCMLLVVHTSGHFTVMVAIHSLQYGISYWKTHISKNPQKLVEYLQLKSAHNKQAVKIQISMVDRLQDTKWNQSIQFNFWYPRHLQRQIR